MGETYYEVLEVDADATRDEIEAAYRDRVLETHPDHNDAPDAAEQFRRVSTAKSVLTDGSERARYDRLGHDAYVRLARRTADSSDPGEDTDADPASSDANTTTDGHRTGGRDWTRTASEYGSSSTSDRTGGPTSHHARERTRRQRRTAHQRTADPWSFGSGTATSVGSASSSGATSSGTTSASTDADSSTSGFQYTVHGWDGEIDLEWDGQPIEHTTAVTIGCLWVLYPVFVAASLTSLFPVVVNVIVAACAIGSVGYLLTRPRIAAAVFGSWSLLFPVGMVQIGPVPPLSVVGLVVLGFVWIPFGYALVLWWALRP